MFQPIHRLFLFCLGFVDLSFGPLNGVVELSFGLIFAFIPSLLRGAFMSRVRRPVVRTHFPIHPFAAARGIHANLGFVDLSFGPFSGFVDLSFRLIVPCFPSLLRGAFQVLFSTYLTNPPFILHLPSRSLGRPYKALEGLIKPVSAP